MQLTYLHAADFCCLPTLLTISKACVPWLEPSTLPHTEAYYQRRAALQTLEPFQKGRSHMLLLQDRAQAVVQRCQQAGESRHKDNHTHKCK